MGRWSGIHAGVFSVGLGPVLVSLTDRRGTRWQLALMPFGATSNFWVIKMRRVLRRHLRLGPCGLMICAEQCTERHFGHAPLQLLQVRFNFILAAAIFALIALWQGQARDPLTIGELYPLPFEHGLKNGDIFLEINDISVPSVDDDSAFSTFGRVLGMTIPILIQ